ncbi:unnamed protein product [Didymodactylos carnosus]|uniref:SecA family profile domain-containing protein n=1 Tax=Didymodactylos carnosus TaxID=1234261 RepID=A0A814UPM2_9BILA|nr:unnamed protein product [Didymodactylos carnosus]CAF3940855.1 unnamed protein product [Didymodactylos carnosus]
MVTSSIAWGAIGHSLVSQIAMTVMTNESRRFVKDLLPWYVQGNMSMLSSWADNILYPDTNPVGYLNWDWSREHHYINTPDGVCEYIPDRDCVENKCIDGAIQNYTRRLADTGFDHVQRQEALQFLVHHVGDVHQPLHAGFISDRGGNSVRGRFFNVATNLHSLWDSGIINRRVNTDFNRSAEDYFEYLMTKVNSTYANIITQWLVCPIQTQFSACSASWAQESSDLVCGTVNIAEDGSLMNSSWNFTLGLNYFNKNWPIVESRLIQVPTLESVPTTNLAGRGSDIKISKELHQNGGLHVILNYLPKNYRIEQQAFGRTARQGQYGSGQLIIVDQSNLEYSNKSLLEVIYLKNERDFNEMHRIGEVLQYYQRKIQFEENLFERYYQAFSRLKEKIDKRWKINVEKKDIVLSSLLNQWAFWSDNIDFQMNAKLEIFQSLENLCHQFEQIHNFDELIDQLVIEPNQLIKLSKCFIKDKNYDKACQLLQTVINNEPMFSHAAYYYKAHCLIKQTQLVKTKEKIEFHRLLDHAEYLFNYHIDMLIAHNSILTNLNLLNQSFLKIDSYRKQNKNLCNLYSCFIRSIHDIRGHSITSNTFVNIDIDEKLAMSIYKQMLISDENIFIRKQFNRNFNENQLKKICMDYQLNYDGFQRYLSQIKYVDEMNLKQYLDHVQMPNRDQF